MFFLQIQIFSSLVLKELYTYTSLIRCYIHKGWGEGAAHTTACLLSCRIKPFEQGVSLKGMNCAGAVSYPRELIPSPPLFPIPIHIRPHHPVENDDKI